jgi:short-subunit dehydrogenase
MITKGNIINRASTAVLHGHAFMSAYAASKEAIVAVTQSLAQESLLQDICVNAVASSVIDTQMNKSDQISLDINRHLLDNLKNVE